MQPWSNTCIPTPYFPIRVRTPKGKICGEAARCSVDEGFCWDLGLPQESDKRSQVLVSFCGEVLKSKGEFVRFPQTIPSFGSLFKYDLSPFRSFGHASISLPQKILENDFGLIFSLSQNI
ncbi:hypothetical protein TWF718_001417 [Orbilia javanica]|uniref:Uncharacterized protein n=1 Tax=Orbilia javanica TaxID=47235 RepID=A0AAN8RSG2_9PEZI